MSAQEFQQQVTEALLAVTSPDAQTRTAGSYYLSSIYHSLILALKKLV